MRKKFLYFIIIITCVGLTSFKKECNNDTCETSLKKDVLQKTVRAEPKNLEISPFYHLLEI
jgi:hypothetical protein